MFVRKPALKTLCALTASGTLLLGVTLLTSSRSQSIDKPDTPLKVALVLDCITQPRFQDDMKNFGMSRLLPAAGGHLAMGQLMLMTQKDRELMQTADNAHRDYAIGFFHCAHVPGSPSKTPAGIRPGGSFPEHPRKLDERSKPGQVTDAPTPSSDLAERVSPVRNSLRHLYHGDRKVASETEQNLYREMGKAAQKALPKLMKGQGVEQDAGDWLVVARPVRAMKTSCLKCHQGAKQGDTLGVLTYVVSKKTFADAGPFPGRKAVTSNKGGF